MKGNSPAAGCMLRLRLYDVETGSRLTFDDQCRFGLGEACAESESGVTPMMLIELHVCIRYWHSWMHILCNTHAERSEGHLSVWGGGHYRAQGLFGRAEALCTLRVRRESAVCAY